MIIPSTTFFAKISTAVSQTETMVMLALTIMAHMGDTTPAVWRHVNYFFSFYLFYVLGHNQLSLSGIFSLHENEYITGAAIGMGVGSKWVKSNVLVNCPLKVTQDPFMSKQSQLCPLSAVSSKSAV